MKKILWVLLGVIIAGGIYLYFHGVDIFQTSAESVIRQKLPPYVSVGDIIFDMEKKSLGMMLYNFMETFEQKLFGEIPEVLVQQ